MRKSKRWKATVNRILCVTMAFVLLTGVSGFTSDAEETGNLPGLNEEEVEVELLEAQLLDDPTWQNVNVRTMLRHCVISVSGDSEGMHIDIFTGTVGTASRIGVKDIKIYKKTWYGGWNLVAVCDGLESTNTMSSGITILYPNAVKDATYKITAVHYADVDGYEEGTTDTGAFKYSFYQS